MGRPIKNRISLLVCGALLLVGCAGPARAALAPTEQQTTSGPKDRFTISVTPEADQQPTLPAATYPVPVASLPTDVPPTTIEVSAEPLATPAVIQASLPLVRGQNVLALSAGDGPDQVGVYGESPDFTGPNAFRIGGDGTIRILDRVNQRVLFFDRNGKHIRTLKMDADPMDFIVSSQGEAFVYGRIGSDTWVLGYGSDGKLIERLPVSVGVSVVADGITLNADQDVMLAQDNQALWVIRRRGIVVPPEIQTLTRQEGAVTPRSPTIFQTVAATGGAPELRVIGLAGGITGESMVTVANLTPQLPADARFFNIDRAMNLYFASDLHADQFNVWRVLPDGTVAGGARIAPGCRLSWRTFYVDQAGAAWTLCTNSTGVTMTRYKLLDLSGHVLPEADQQAADVLWKPGARLDGA